MGALNPFFLLAGLAAAVPVFLHLFQRQEARRVSFPALRYLERTEREHARRIRFRQMLLLLLRVTAVLALAAAGAGLFLRGDGSAHPATALAIVLDNSLSSGAVVGETRVLDGLKKLALSTLAAASDRDRIWVIRAGEPWVPAAPGSPREARRWVEESQVTAASGDLRAALSRAAELVSASGLDAREIHLLSDLQATAFASGSDAPARDVPVVVWVPAEEPPPNRALTLLRVGGGLPPLEGQRYEATVQAAVAAGGETSAVPVRIVLDGRVQGAAALPPGATVTLPLPPAHAGWTVGFAEADPDALHADDQRFFAFRARPMPRVALAGDPGVFFADAAAVLETAARLRIAGLQDADIVVSSAGEGLDARPGRTALLVLPPTDPTLLPALNRRLDAAGIPWRVDAQEGTGEVALAGGALPEPLVGVRVRRWYRLSLAGDPPAPTRTLARAGSDPWAVEGTDTSGRRYLLLASPLDAESSSLPLSSAMVRAVDWATVTWAASGSSATEHVAGVALSAPREADVVRLPSGAELPLDGTRMVRATAEAGIYTFLAGDTVVAQEAVNPDAAESDLTPLTSRRLADAVGSRVTSVDREDAWNRAIFRERQGPELGRGLLALALAVLILEAVVASAGRSTAGARGGRPTDGGHARS